MISKSSRIMHNSGHVKFFSGEIKQKKVQLDEITEKLDSKDVCKSEEVYKRNVITKCVTEKVIEVTIDRLIN